MRKAAAKPHRDDSHRHLIARAHLPSIDRAASMPSHLRLPHSEAIVLLDSHANRNLPQVASQERIIFKSQYEAAIAIMLEKYVPDWQVKVGETYQVPISKLGHTADFAIPYNGSLLLMEFHRFNHKHGWANPKTSGAVAAALEQIKSEAVKRDLTSAIVAEHQSAFKERRKLILRLNEDPKMQEAEYLFISSFQDFYSLIIRRFGESYPDQRKLKREWEQLLRETEKAQG